MRFAIPYLSLMSEFNPRPLLGPGTVLLKTMNSICKACENTENMFHKSVLLCL